MEIKHPGLTNSNARVRNDLFEIEFMLSNGKSYERSISCNGVLMLSISLNIVVHLGTIDGSLRYSHQWN